MYDILKESKGVYDMLQNAAIDYCRAADLIESLIEELQTYRCDAKAANYYQSSMELAKKNKLKYTGDSEDDGGQKRQRGAPSHLKNFVILSSLGKHDSVTDAVHFNTLILFPTVDKFLNELRRRFCSENLNIFRSLSALDPTSKQFLNDAVVKPLAQHYSLNIEDLALEMRQAKRMFQRTGEKFASMVELAECLKPLHMAFTELCKAIQIALTLPASTAGCERVFSKLKIIKSHLRTTMVDARLKSLAVISVHRQRALNMDLDEVVDRMVKTFPKMRIVLV